MSQSEFDIIHRYFSGPSWPLSQDVVLGAGDDCAILNVPGGKELMVSTDTLVEGVHFPMNWDAGLIASRALRVNLSDLAAMGADPLACTLALTLGSAEEIWLQQFSDAFRSLSVEFEIPLVGGNLAKGPLSITIQVMGTVAAGKGLRRSRAECGDEIYVTGLLGEGAGGLKVIQDQRSESEFADLLMAYCHPHPRLIAGQKLLGLASAAIDVSDGLMADLGHLVRASGVGAQLNFDEVPISENLIKLVGTEQAREMALTGGDDYELCFTAPAELRSQILSTDFGVMVTRIGKVTAAGAGVTLLDGNGQAIDLAATGYLHF